MKNIVVSILVSGLVTLGILHFVEKDKTATPIAIVRETAFNRVVRTGELRCGYVNWAPYFMQDVNDKTKEPTGVNVEITKAIGQILGLKIVWAEEVGWGNLIEGLNTGRYDAICTSAWPDSPKMKHSTLSDAMFYDTLFAYVRTDDHRFDGNLTAINSPDVKIAAVDGGTSMENAKSAFPQAQIFAISPNAPTGDYYTTVVTKKADVIITSPGEFAEFDKGNPGKIKRVENTQPIRFMPMTMILGEGEEKLRDRIDFVLQMLIDNGDMDKMVTKYSKDYVLRTPNHK